MRSRDDIRQLYILKILYEKTDDFHPLTTSEILSILEQEYGIKAHRITIKDDILAFKEFGIEIAEERKTQNQYRLISRTFTASELKVLIDAVQSAKFITAGQSKDLSERIATLASCHEKETLKRHITVEDRYKAQNTHSLYYVDTINSAINQEKKLSFRYFKYSTTKHKVAKNNGERYVFSPYYLIWNGDYYYAVGYSDKHNSIGSFRVDRIMENPVILNESAIPMPKDFKINEYIHSMLHMYNSEHATVELICDNDAVDALIDKFGAGIKIRKHDAGHFKAVVDVAVNHVFFAWVFGFGGKVQIAAPAEIQERYAKMVNEAAKANPVHEGGDSNG